VNVFFHHDFAESQSMEGWEVIGGTWTIVNDGVKGTNPNNSWAYLRKKFQTRYSCFRIEVTFKYLPKIVEINPGVAVDCRWERNHFDIINHVGGVGSLYTNYWSMHIMCGYSDYCPNPWEKPEDSRYCGTTLQLDKWYTLAYEVDETKVKQYLDDYLIGEWEYAGEGKCGCTPMEFDRVLLAVANGEAVFKSVTIYSLKAEPSQPAPPSLMEAAVSAVTVFIAGVAFKAWVVPELKKLIKGM